MESQLITVKPIPLKSVSTNELIQLPTQSSVTNYQIPTTTSEIVTINNDLLTSTKHKTGSMSVNGNAGGGSCAHPWSDPHYRYGNWLSAQCSVNKMSTNNLKKVSLNCTTASKISNSQTTLTSPSVFYTNCRSLNLEKLANLRQFTVRYYPDVICLKETMVHTRK